MHQKEFKNHFKMKIKEKKIIKSFKTPNKWPIKLWNVRDKTRNI